MSKTFLLILFLSTVSRLMAGDDFQPNDTIRSGVPWFDSDGNVINCHAISIIQVGKRFYMVGEKETNKSFALLGDLESNFTGVSLYSSDDLVNWKHLNDPLVPLERTSIGRDCIVGRPKLLYNGKNKEFVLYLHTWKGDGNIGFCTSQNVGGPYAYQGTLKFQDGKPIMGGDIGVFQDTDDTAYLLETSGNMYKLSPDYKSASNARLPNAVKVVSSEAPAMFKLGNTYYFLSSLKTWWHNNNNFYATAPTAEGPWTDRGTFCPEGSKTWNSQTTWVLPVVGNKSSFCIYMGDRWSDGDLIASSSVWQPFVADGGALSIPEYHPEWKINLTEGVWSDVKDNGMAINDIDNDKRSKSITYSGSWMHTSEKAGDYSYHADDSYSSTPGDTASLQFEGKRVRLYSVVDHQHGIIGIRLYDRQGTSLGDETDVDLYTDASRQGNYLCYASPLLREDRYTVVVRITGKKNFYSSGTYGVIDRFTIEKSKQ